MAIVSCKKEAVVSPATTTNVSYDKQIADLIQKSDSGLYNQLYNPTPNQKFPVITIKSLPGIFYIPTSGIDNATCWPAYNVCMIIVSAIETNGDGGEESSIITSDISEVYPEGVTTKLIINSDSVETKEIKSFSAQKGENGVFYVKYN